MTETTEPTVAAAQPETKTPETATTPAEGDSAPAAVSGSEEKATTNGDASPEAAAEEPAKEPVKEMRAVVLTGFGGYKGVKIQKKPEPTAQAGEVLIRVRAW